ncbi:MAG: EAL domain-containing protein [Magnetococcales bacterium]|nr:EAL domain-containing protein [Magnetococcales bacterium]
MGVGITTRTILVFTLINLIIAGSVGYMVQEQSSVLLIEKSLETLGEEEEIQRSLIQERIRRFSGDVRFLANTPPIQGIVRTRLAGGIDPVDQSTEPLWRQRLSVIFSTFLNNHPEYFQVRYVGVADGGREIVRVERQENQVRVVPEAELPQKGDRDYFQKILSMPPGEVFLSEINLNREHGQPVTPHLPTLRVAVPVHTPHEEPFGFIILNVDMGETLADIAALAHPPTQLYLTNSQGDFLIHPQAGVAFAFEYGEAANLASLFSDLAQALAKMPSLWGSRERHTEMVGEDVRSAIRIPIDPFHPERYLSLVMVTPREAALADVMAMRKKSTLLIGSLLLIGTLLVFAFSRRLTRPLQQMTRAVERFSLGEADFQVPVESRDEIGVLAEAFQQMAQRITRDQMSLLNRERHIRAIMESALDGIFTTDRQGVILSANGAMAGLFGYPVEQLVGQNIKMLIPSPHQESHERYLAHFLTLNRGQGEAGGGGFIREVEGVHQNGQLIPVALSLSHFVVGETTIITGILHDISERKATLAALQDAHDKLEVRVQKRTRALMESTTRLEGEILERKRGEAKLRLLAKVFENTSEGILITDAQSHILDVNQAFTEITGYARSEAIGNTPRLTKSDRHDAEFYQEMWGTLLASGRWSGEIWDRRKDGSLYPKKLSINAVHDNDGLTSHYVGVFSDISQLKQTEERLERLAYYDALTGLPNRVLFKDRLNQECLQARRTGHRVAVMFLDLDRFKYVNDTLGHAFGDRLLVDVGNRLMGCVRESDTVARLGGDEFTIILGDCGSEERVGKVSEKILEAIQKQFVLDGKELFIGVSIGIGIYPDNGEDFDTLTKNADAAMYRAKESGRNTYRFFSEEMNAASSQRLDLEASLRLGLERGEFCLHYQPKVAMESGRIVGMESLVRWQHPEKGMISPAEFIPIAEETGFIVPLGEWILKTACRQAKKWLDAGFWDLTMAVNLSVRQFQHQDLLELVERVVRENGLPRGMLELEITESMVMGDVGQAVTVLEGLREMGIKLSVDDFGTGYSSLSYLKRLPIQTLKIDQSFVRDLSVSSSEAAIVAAIISMAKSLNLMVVAEGVENQEQVDFLRERGCDQIQGFFCSRPLPSRKMLQLLAEGGQLV